MTVPSQGVNLVNANDVSLAFGTRTLLSHVSLGLNAGDVIGVVGRNGDGKSTLLRLLTGSLQPDEGRITRTSSVSVGVLTQAEQVTPGETVRDLIVSGAPDHVWASDTYKREVVEHLLGDIDLDAVLGDLSGGERRRAGLVSLMLGRHDLLVLDEPTNHLDVEAVSWLARHLNQLQARGVAMLVVSHDRWFLDAVCNRVWEVHDAVVDPYEGGYAAYVLARAERTRQAAANEARRQNLVRKELAWLRRGAPARTSKPKFRIEAANELIADVPEPRDKLALQQFSISRLGKDVIDLKDVSYVLPNGRALFRDITWSIGPGERIGLVGVNGSGKSTLFNLLSAQLAPTGGIVKHGKTLRLGYLSQHVSELDDDDQVLASVNRLKQETRLATGREVSASSLLEDFGFTGDKLITRIGDLSGGERRRLQLLRLLISDPNVLLLDEPTNDLDIDTLTVLEDYLDNWPGTLIVASHDRYFMERVTDVVYGLLPQGQIGLLPGGIEQYLTQRAAARDTPAASTSGSTQNSRPTASQAARLRTARKELARLDGQLARIQTRLEQIHTQMVEAAADYSQLARLQGELNAQRQLKDELEEQWLTAAEVAEQG